MTTAIFTSSVDHSSDAGFRAWGSEFNAKLAAVGLVQTTDTGQVNWTTVTRPVAGVATAYEIWKFIDSSIYVKVLYGTGSTTSSPRVDFQTGSGSNGSGTLTGQLSTQQTFCQNQALASAVTPYTSYFSHTSNFLTILWKMNAVTGLYPAACLVIGKTVDGTGAATAVGYGIVRQQQSGIGNSCDFQIVRNAATAFTGPAGVSGGQVVSPIGAVTSGVKQNGDIQVYLGYMAMPDVLPWVWTPLMFLADTVKLSTYPVAMVASASHTYLVIGSISNTNGPFGYATTMTLGIPFE